jgi:hypothetical protein
MATTPQEKAKALLIVSCDGMLWGSFVDIVKPAFSHRIIAEMTLLLGPSE